MKSHLWLIAGLALAAGAACGDTSDRAGNTEADRVEDPLIETTSVSPADSNIVYVDVRTAEEFARGHVKGAIHIPHSEMADRYEELDQYHEKEIVVYCRTGRRSGIARMILENQGFDNVRNGGGLGDLEAQGVPTTR